MTKKQSKNFWSLNVDEVLVADWLKEKLKGCEVFFPLNSQFPFVDLIVYNPENQKTATIQVKSSQSYFEKDEEEHYWASAQRFESWKVDPDKVDFFIFSCYNPISPKNVKNKTGPRNIENYFVVFHTKELQKYNEKYKNSKIKKRKEVAYSFDIWPPYTRQKEGNLRENWYIKIKYEDDRTRQTILSKALENWKTIKTKLQ